MDAPKPGRVAIVIVNWNSGALLRQCLQSMIACRHPERIAQVVVVDNDSHDGSCDDLPQVGFPVHVIHNETNRGFAVACNQGAALCMVDVQRSATEGGNAEFLLFLNPDAELLPDSLDAPLSYLEDSRNQDVGICGIQLLDERGSVARSCSRLPTCSSLVAMALRLNGLSRRWFPPHFMKEWDHLQTRDVDQVIGAFFLVRTQLFEDLNGFDERFFVYFEEVDFCQRTRQRGLKTVYLASAQARHVGAGCSSQVRGRALFYSLRSRIAYAEKHLPRWQATLVRAATFVGEPSIRIAATVLKLKWKNLRPLISAFALLWQDRFMAKPTTDPLHRQPSKALVTENA
jgi:N-acetylglucosaminyl-diphospho-decaprenol L-rhamnosyltransferase